jgi:hypothetical protein
VPAALRAQQTIISISCLFLAFAVNEPTTPAKSQRGEPCPWVYCAAGAFGESSALETALAAATMTYFTTKRAL